MSVINGKIILTKNPCYQTYQRMTPKGIVVHSTGANNPYIKRYVQPDDGIIGKNIYGNDWNNPDEDVCVHGFIGKDKKNNVKFYQTLPFDICCWGVGGGWNGSYNYDPAFIQFEMCEDDLRDKSYCKACYNKAVEVCAYLCKKYKISVDNVVSHREAYLRGYGSDHVDPTNWWDKFGYTMDGFRAAVRKKIAVKKEKPTLDKKGYKKGDRTIGVLAFKCLLILAKDKGIIKQGVDFNGTFGNGTEKAVNKFLKKWGYKRNGIAGKNFIKKLETLLKK